MTARCEYKLYRHSDCGIEDCKFFRAPAQGGGTIPPINLVNHLALRALPDVLYAVVTKTAHCEAFAIRDDSIETLAPNPCSDWRKFISRLYDEGYRYVHFEVDA